MFFHSLIPCRTRLDGYISGLIFASCGYLPALGRHSTKSLFPVSLYAGFMATEERFSEIFNVGKRLRPQFISSRTDAASSPASSQLPNRPQLC